ncbi:uncharacterized protein [Dermacentor albipictus]|uniref:uncharacterized protein n=1 Tax=Dermacentor albipictus TaxID=60249 RepID=UPI0038FBE5D0
MKRNVSFMKFLSMALLSLINEVLLASVNLEDEAKSYFDKLNKSEHGGIVHWSLDSGSKIWINGKLKSQMKTSVYWIHYERYPEYLDVRLKSCTGSFVWTVTDSIISPFPIMAHVAVPVKVTGLTPRMVQFDLNNLTSTVQKIEKWNHQTSTLGRANLLRRCTFVANVGFHGYLQYSDKLRDETMETPHAVGVGVLEDKEKGLESHDDDETLTYNVTGIYQESIYCFDVNSNK